MRVFLRSTVALVLLAALALPIDINRGIFLHYLDDLGTGYPMKQFVYNAFGELVAVSPAERWLGFDYLDETYGAAGKRYNMDGTVIGFRYGFHGDVMYDKAPVLFTDKFLIADLDFKLEYKADSRKTYYSSYTLANNMLNGFWLTLSNKAFGVEFVWSYLRAVPAQTHVANYVDVWQVYGGEEADYLIGANIDLAFLTSIKSELFTVNNLDVSWSVISHKDSLSHAPALLGSAPVLDSAIATTNYTYTNITYIVTPYRSFDASNFTAFYGGTVEFEGAGTNISIPIPAIAPAGTVLSNDSVGTPYLHIPEGVTYTFPVIMPAVPGKKVKVTLFLANSFYVQQVFNTRLPYDTLQQQQLHMPVTVVLSSKKHNIRDFSNKKGYDFYLGVNTANHNFGVEADLTFAGISLKGGFFPNLQLYQAPQFEADYIPQLSYAWYAEASKRIGGFYFNAAAYSCNPDFRTEFMPVLRVNYVYFGTSNSTIPPYERYFQVLDNDNDDFMSTYRPDPRGLLDTYESPSNAVDVNKNRYPDYNEDFLLFNAYDNFYVRGDDWNNNGLNDMLEDDLLPDYRYRENFQGFHGDLGLEIIPKIMTTSVYAALDNVASDVDAVSRLIETKISINYEVKNTIALAIDARYKRVQDLIYNDVSPGTYPNDPDRAIDQLQYRDSSVFDGYLNATFFPIKDISVKAVGHMEYNIQHDLNNRLASRVGELFGIYYNVPVTTFFKDDKALSAFFSKLRFNTALLVQLFDFAYSPNEPLYSQGTRRIAAMGKFSLDLGPGTKFYLGYQYLNSIDLYDSRRTLQKHSGAIELDNTTKGFTLMLGWAFDYYIYADPINAQFNGYRDKIFLRILSKA